MLRKHLAATVRPQADEKNIVFWKNYRVTVLSDRLLRLEHSENRAFRDEATQSVWFRDMPAREFRTEIAPDKAVVDTGACKLILREKRADCRLEIKGRKLPIANIGNLSGTARTLDCCDGDIWYEPWHKDVRRKIALGTGVCSRAGVAVFDDAASLTLGCDGEVKPRKGDGSDEYIFAFGDDYRGAVRALYEITGQVPMIPRFALGNWWSRYYAYSDEEYLRMLSTFEQRRVPLTIATIDMDWHYSDPKEIDETFAVSSRGLNEPQYVGELGANWNYGWTGYSWNKRLFPDYKAFLKQVQARNLRITLNLHPADGVRFWEDAYADMAKAMGIDPESKRCIPFDFSDSDFINAYFSVLHKPYERDGVGFWWIDWQQGETSKTEGLDPLWALNHYHYLDHAADHDAPLILSRYAGVGSHRYPIGFSGDTYITWNTLAYLPYFTATASNIGYTWWSHDIGGHMEGEKSDELYVRHVQFGVFSPVNRLHGCNLPVMTKEPWVYKNGAGLIAEEFLRFRHKLIPYLYTAAYRTHADGIALIEPMYYRHDAREAYRYPTQYYFGDLLVAPVTQKRKADGYARVKAWLPEGRFTDIFTGDRYDVPKGGAKTVLLRTLDSIPVLAKAGSVLPLSADEGNGCDNPTSLEVWAYAGNGGYTLYEDAVDDNTRREAFTQFDMCASDGMQALRIATKGDDTVVPHDRTLTVYFKDIDDGDVTLYADDVPTACEKRHADCVCVRFAYDAAKKYRLTVAYKEKSPLQYAIERAKTVLTCAEGDNEAKNRAFACIAAATDKAAYLAAVDGADISRVAKARLKETVSF